jgi:hypothetical protein
MIAQLVTYSGTNGVAFNPSELVTPIINGALVAVSAAGALFIIALGIKWLFRSVKESGVQADDHVARYESEVMAGDFNRSNEESRQYLFRQGNDF